MEGENASIALAGKIVFTKNEIGGFFRPNLRRIGKFPSNSGALKGRTGIAALGILPF